jgi:hypothetical protein
MRRLFAILLTMSWIVADAPAFAQFVPQVPNLENRIPAPLPPPPQSPDINGPLFQGAAPPVVDQPRHLNTFSDRVTGCVAQGANGGLRGGELDAYTRDCANDN